MKTLYLLRHAEAGSGSPSGQDIDRPLTAHGEKQAAETGEYLLSQGFPRLVLCSTSKRTQQTMTIVMEAFGMTDIVNMSEDLYLAPVDTLRDELETAADSFDSVMIVAHNPGLAEFALQLSNDDLRAVHFSPATVAVFDCDIQSWSQLSQKNAKLRGIFTPA